MQPLEKPINLTLQINPGEDYDPIELDRLTRQLLSEIEELDVQSAELVKTDEVPDGAKSGEMVTLGALVVTVLPIIAPKIVDLLQSWSMRAESRVVKIKAQVDNRSIEVEYSPAAMSTSELKRLLNTISQVIPPAEKS